MTPEPEAPSPSRGSPPDSGKQAGAGGPGEDPRLAEAQPAERYGPVAIARYVKDDGRALLLYSRAAEERA